MTEKFHSSSFKDPIRQDEVEFNDKGVTFREKKLIGGTDNFVFYSDISGVEIDNGLFFATIRVIPRMRNQIVLNNFTKGDARRIKELILQNVPDHRRRRIAIKIGLIPIRLVGSGACKHIFFRPDTCAIRQMALLLPHD